MLSSLLNASQKNAASLKVVPKGSVKVARAASSCPIAPGPSSRVQDWFRPRVEVDEIEEEFKEMGDSELSKKPDAVKSMSM